MSAILRKEDCESAVKNLLKSTNFVLKDYEVKPISDKTVGFMGRHYKLTATVFFEGNHKELQFFAKFAPTKDFHRRLVIEHNFFGKEIATYNTLVPKLATSLPSDTKLPVPRCLFTRGTKTPAVAPVPGSEDEELIILEDVTRNGYRLLENSPPLDLPHCRAVLTALARFHAASLLLEHSARSSPQIIPSRDLFPCAEENFLILQEGLFGYEWAKYSAISMATAITKMWPNRFQGQREKVLATLMEGWKRTFDIAKTSRKYQNVLCHGDLWTNNILFLYKPLSDGKEEPVAVKFVDLQLVRYAPPILDILLFLHVCTRRTFRDEHLEELLRHYHSSLEAYVSPSLLEKVLPLSSLFESHGELKTFGQLMSTAYIPVILQESDALLLSNGPIQPTSVEELFFVDKGETIAANCRKSFTCKERVVDTFQECLECLRLWS